MISNNDAFNLYSNKKLKKSVSREAFGWKQFSIFVSGIIFI